MKLSVLMADYTPSAQYNGALMADDFVLAIAPITETNVGNFLVVQQYVEGVNSSINATTVEKQYIRSGRSTTKTANQRTFSVSGDRFIGDEAQDFLDSKKYATGQDAVCAYVYFNLKNGKGEKGQLTISLDTDAGGNAGDNASFSATLSKVGAAPETFEWSDISGVYSVLLDANGGTIASGHDVTSYTTGTAVTLPDSSYVTRTGYTFDGWYDTETLTVATTIAATDTGDKTFLAKWSEE